VNDSVADNNKTRSPAPHRKTQINQCFHKSAFLLSQSNSTWDWWHKKFKTIILPVYFTSPDITVWESLVSNTL